MGKSAIFFFVILLSAITALGDFFIKKASLQSKFSGLIWLISGSLVYVATAFGWFIVLKKMKLSIAVVAYSVSLILLVVLIGVFYFHEKLNWPEIVGIILALVSLVLLYRFA